MLLGVFAGEVGADEQEVAAGSLTRLRSGGNSIELPEAPAPVPVVIVGGSSGASASGAKGLESYTGCMEMGAVGPAGVLEGA